MAGITIFESESYGESDVADIELCKKVWEVLDKHYPRHPWMVGADHFAGVVTIQLAYEDGKLGLYARHGWVLHIRKLETPDEFKKVMRAGGDMLERFKLIRGAATAGSAQQALQNGINKDGLVL